MSIPNVIVQRKYVTREGAFRWVVILKDEDLCYFDTETGAIKYAESIRRALCQMFDAEVVS